MKYVTRYDIGDRKRKKNSINEDSVSVVVFEDGHRDGLTVDRPKGTTGQMVSPEDGATKAGTDDTDVTDRKRGEETANQSQASKELDEIDDRMETTRQVKQTEPSENVPAEKHTTATPETLPPYNRNAGVFVLADGAGGHDAGDVASYLATTVATEELTDIVHQAIHAQPEGFNVDIKEEVLPAIPTAKAIREKIESAIVTAHESVLRYSVAAEKNAFTTIVAGVYVDETLHLGWAGDSRAYLINEAHERIEQLTNDHSKVQKLTDEGKIDEYEAHVHQEGNEITSAIGGSQYQNPDTSDLDSRELGHLNEIETRTVEPLFSEDVLLFTSDGLIDAQTNAPQLHQLYKQTNGSEEAAERIIEEVVTDEDIMERTLAAGRSDLAGAADALIELANNRGGKDNISLILFNDETLPSTPSIKATGLPTRKYAPNQDIEASRTIIVDEITRVLRSKGQNLIDKQ